MDAPYLSIPTSMTPPAAASAAVSKQPEKLTVKQRAALVSSQTISATFGGGKALSKPESYAPTSTVHSAQETADIKSFKERFDLVLKQKFGLYAKERAKADNIDPENIPESKRQEYFTDFQKLQAAEFERYKKMNEATKADEEFARSLAGKLDLVDLERELAKAEAEAKAQEAALQALLKEEFSLNAQIAQVRNELPVVFVKAEAEAKAHEASIEAYFKHESRLNAEIARVLKPVVTVDPFVPAAAQVQVPAAAQVEAIKDEEDDFRQISGDGQATTNGSGWMAPLVSWWTWGKGEQKVKDAVKAALEKDVKKP